jgi:chromosome segregation ATPase
MSRKSSNSDQKQKSGRYKPGARAGKGGINKMQLLIKNLQAQVDLVKQQRDDALKQVEKLESQNKQLNQDAERSAKKLQEKWNKTPLVCKIRPIPNGWVQ